MENKNLVETEPEHSVVKLHSIKEAIDDIRAGKIIILVDDRDRENEGDFIAASEMATP